MVRSKEGWLVIATNDEANESHYDYFEKGMLELVLLARFNYIIHFFASVAGVKCIVLHYLAI